MREQLERIAAWLSEVPRCGVCPVEVILDADGWVPFCALRDEGAQLHTNVYAAGHAIDVAELTIDVVTFKAMFSRKATEEELARLNGARVVVLQRAA